MSSETFDSKKAKFFINRQALDAEGACVEEFFIDGGLGHTVELPHGMSIDEEALRKTRQGTVEGRILHTDPEFSAQLCEDHEFVNVGFSTEKLVCKFCDWEKK